VRDHLPRRMCDGVEDVCELQCRKEESVRLGEVFPGFASYEFLREGQSANVRHRHRGNDNAGTEKTSKQVGIESVKTRKASRI